LVAKHGTDKQAFLLAYELRKILPETNWLVEMLNGNSVSRLMSNNLWDCVALDDLWCDAQPLHNFSKMSLF
jgi:hypothetical protein